MWSGLAGGNSTTFGSGGGGPSLVTTISPSRMRPEPSRGVTRNLRYRARPLTGAKSISASSVALGCVGASFLITATCSQVSPSWLAWTATVWTRKSLVW